MEDFSDVDLKFAYNNGLKFMIPEELFEINYKDKLPQKFKGKDDINDITGYKSMMKRLEEFYGP
jgi:hypothetical protein